LGEVVRSRREGAGSAAWLRDLAAALDEIYGQERLAPFGFTRDGEIQGLLAPEADPLTAVLNAALGPGARRMRWVAVRGEAAADPDGGGVPATQRTGPVFVEARRVIDGARAGHERLVLSTGRPDVDALLGDLAPALVDVLDGLTERQRTVARMAVLEDLRQSEVADRLNVRRATISVSFNRARVRSLRRLVTGIRRVYSSGSGYRWQAAVPDEPVWLPGASSRNDARGAEVEGADAGDYP